MRKSWCQLKSLHARAATLTVTRPRDKQDARISGDCKSLQLLITYSFDADLLNLIYFTPSSFIYLFCVWSVKSFAIKIGRKLCSSFEEQSEQFPLELVGSPLLASESKHGPEFAAKGVSHSGAVPCRARPSPRLAITSASSCYCAFVTCGWLGSPRSDSANCHVQLHCAQWWG